MTWTSEAVRAKRANQSDKYRESRCEEEMDIPNEYRKPILVELGNVTELMQGTLIKGHVGVLELPIGNRRIISAYDLDE